MPRPIIHLSFFQSEIRITAEDCVLDAVNLRREILDVLVNILVIVHQVLVNHVATVAEEVVKKEEDHEGEGDEGE